MELLINVGDEDGNTVLHLAIARKQSLTVKLLLGADGIAKGTVRVNASNKSGLTALDVLDVVEQMVSEPTDYILRELLLRAGAQRASELAHRNTRQVDLEHETPSPPQSTLSRCLLYPIRIWKSMAYEVRQASPHTREALMVVAILIAGMTYQVILNPLGGTSVDPITNEFYSNLAGVPYQFYLFMIPNTAGFFTSIALIILLIDEFRLKPLFRIAVHCMVASYVSGFLFIGPTSVRSTQLGALVILLLVLLDISYWLIKILFWDKLKELIKICWHGTFNLELQLV